MSPPSSDARKSIRRRRRLRFAFRLNNLSAWLLALVLLGMVNYLSFLYYYRVDITRSQFYALSEKTRKLLNSLESDVHVWVCFSPTHAYYEHVKNLLEEYRYISKYVKVEMIDPHRDLVRMRELAATYGFTGENVLLFASEDVHEIVTDRELKKVEYSTLQIPPVPSAVYFRGEVVVSSSIRSVINPHFPKVYFLQGHDERDFESYDEYTGYSDIVEAIRDDHIDLQALTIGEKREIPEDAEALVIAGPARKISQPELDIIRRYLEGNGRIVMLLDPFRNAGLDEILQDWGVLVAKDLVLDSSRTLSGKELVVSAYGSHPITRPLSKSTTIFYLARSVEPAVEPHDGNDLIDKPRVTVLAASSDKGWAEMSLDQSPIKFDPVTDLPGPNSIAVAVEKGPVPGIDVQIRPTRMVVVGDSDFISNGHLSGGNQAFFMGALNWLLERDQMMEISPKPFEEYRLMITRRQMRMIFLVVVLGIPSGVGAVGILVWLRRRR